MSSQVLKELSEGAKYDNYIKTAFKDVKTKSPKRPEEEIDEEIGNERLQITLTKNNLKQIISGTSLINNIVNYLIEINNLIDFNKYFNIFKNTIQSKIKTLNKFKEDWILFQSQELGEQLTTQPIIIDTKKVLPIYPSNLEYYNNMSTLEIDNHFRKLLEESTGLPINEINTFRYPTTKIENNKPKLSQPIEIKENNEGIIEFKIPAQTKGINKEAKINNIKIRTILYIAEPNISFHNLVVDWKPSIEGSGLFKKKKLVRIIFP